MSRVQGGVFGTLEKSLITPRLISAFSACGRIRMPNGGVQFGFFFVFFSEAFIKNTFVGRVVYLRVKFVVVVQGQSQPPVHLAGS